MKIENNSLYPTRSSDETSSTASSRGTGKLSSQSDSGTDAAGTVSDTVQLGLDQRKLDALRAQLSSQPEVRWDRVSNLQEQIRNGSYLVTNEQIADAMIAEML